MKKLILSSILIAFAVAVQAGDSKTESKTCTGQSACCSKAKSTEQTKATGCCSGMKMTSKETPGKQALLSPKAAAELGK